MQVLLGEVTQLNPQDKQIVFNNKSLSYDYLVLATGSGSTYFGHEEWRSFAPPMKILEHAEEIRRRLLMAMEQAEQTPDPNARQFLQSVVIVGAGPTGCEMAGAVSELMRNAMRREFKQLNPDQTKIYLVDPGERVLRAMPEMLSKSARTTLESLGVEMVFKGRVQSMQPGEVMISTPNGDQCLQAATVIWTAGVRPSHLGRNLADTIGCELDRGGTNRCGTRLLRCRPSRNPSRWRPLLLSAHNQSEPPTWHGRPSYASRRICGPRHRCTSERVIPANIQLV